jgi:hypothetical protein
MTIRYTNKMNMGEWSEGDKYGKWIKKVGCI